MKEAKVTEGNSKYLEIIKSKFCNSIRFKYIVAFLLTIAIIYIILFKYTYYFPIVMISFVIGIMICFIPFCSNYNSKFEILINFSKIILGTLVGVFLGISLNQRYMQVEKVNATLNILQSTKNDIYLCQLLSGKLVDSLTDTNGNNSYKKIRIYQKYKPNTLIEVFKMENVLELVSHRTIEKLSAYTSDMLNLYDHLYDTSYNFKDFIAQDSLYIKNLDVSFNLLKLEIECQKGEIDYDSLNKKVNEDSIKYVKARIDFGYRF
jgi:hypothetical protein